MEANNESDEEINLKDLKKDIDNTIKLVAACCIILLIVIGASTLAIINNCPCHCPCLDKDNTIAKQVLWDTSENPIEGANVSIYNENPSGGDPFDWKMTDEEGWSNFTGLDHGSYWLTVDVDNDGTPEKEEQITIPANTDGVVMEIQNYISTSERHGYGVTWTPNTSNETI